ncbi:MAG: F0F1 ATP synthase subunit delta [Rhodospirillum sp.]|nr:F0F1 ATP synthase subunit delta [Rhodospirillum sp.]MCF8490345.1 F0F1 ATP synthase subunit delta [Rhodospirillum sp.]MCF8502909.1 F0F1 ATP synthase subunit delta [Rhodospirillum sp.]
MSSDMAGVTGVADRYAAALYELADERGALDQVATDLRSLNTMLEESEDLRRAIASPILGRLAQQRALGVLADKAEFSEIVKNFMGLAASNRRAFALPGMIKAFLIRLATARGEVTAHVSTAKAMTQAQEGALAAALKKAMGTDVSIDATVDPAILGGMVVRVGSRMVDSSLSSKLKRLQLAMKGVG